MPVLPEDLPGAWRELLLGVGRAFEGEADAIMDVVTDDVQWHDEDEVLEGADEVLGHLLAHGGWRERMHVDSVEADHDWWLVNWTLWLRADSTSYRRDTVTRVQLLDGLIAVWHSDAVEYEDGSLAPWGGN